MSYTAFFVRVVEFDDAKNGGREFLLKCRQQVASHQTVTAVWTMDMFGFELKVRDLCNVVATGIATKLLLSFRTLLRLRKHEMYTYTHTYMHAYIRVCVCVFTYVYVVCDLCLCVTYCR